MDGLRKVCIIPARGGSKRVPKKNIIDLMGKPLLAYSVEAAKNSGMFGEHIYVSSDSDEILSVGERYGAKPIRRPEEHSHDTAGLEGVTLHFLSEVGAENFDHLCMLMPACPLRTGEDIAESHKQFLEKGGSCLMSVIDYQWLHPFWALQENEDGGLDWFFGKKYLIDSKLLPQHVYCPSGAVRWVEVQTFLQEKAFYGKKVTKYVIPFERGVDIDTFADLEMAKKFHPLVFPKR